MDIDTQAVRRILWCDVAIAASHNYVMVGQPAAVADAVLKAYDERFGEAPVVVSGEAPVEATPAEAATPSDPVGQLLGQFGLDAGGK